MSEPTYRVRIGDGWREVPVPAMDGEALAVPNVAALVYREPAGDALLLQRRDKPGEPVQGRLEVPGGRWRAGEDPVAAVRREVAEETGLEVTRVEANARRVEATPGWPFVVSSPVAVVGGVEGAYPSLHAVYACYAAGEPRPVPGETTDPRWWPLEEIRDLLRTDPTAFVGQTHALLSALLGV